MKMAFVVKDPKDIHLVARQLTVMHDHGEVFVDKEKVNDGDILVCESFYGGDGWHVERDVAPDKESALILDYAENIDRHCPDGDIFNPEIKARFKSESQPMDVPCPLCNHVNQFGARRNDEDYGVDAEGYFTDLSGERIEIAEGQYFPAHYGRRCQGEALVGGRHIQCQHKWSFKECHECGYENDVAARYCKECRAEVVDPNEKLKEMAAKIANDPYRTRFANVTGWMFKEHISGAGQPMVAVEYHIDEPPHMLREYIAPEHPQKFMRDKSNQWCNTVIGNDLGQDFMGRRVIQNRHIMEAYSRAQMPRQVCFKKKAGSKFFEVKGVEL